jgi:hypothetical protein
MTNEDIYNNYFASLDKDDASQRIITKKGKKVFADEESARTHVIEKSPGTDHEVSFYNKADGNISNIMDLAKVIKELCNAAWGDDWGELGLDFKTGEDSASIKLPQIIFDVNTRDISEGLGNLKPVLMDVQVEKDGEGNETGDAFLMYRQWFDTNVEINIYARNNQEAIELESKLENLITVYTGYLKRKGLSEIFFLREISPKSSLNYCENINMRSILYYVRFESIIPVRVNTINNINAKIGANQVTSTKVRSLIQSKASEGEIIELDFFEGDNGITYKN